MFQKCSCLVCVERQWWVLAQGERVALRIQTMLCEELSPAGSLGHSLKIPADLWWTSHSLVGRQWSELFLPWWSVTYWAGA